MRFDTEYFLQPLNLELTLGKVMTAQNFKNLLTSLIAFAALTPSFATAKSGVEAAQLDYVALDTSVECNRILFRSSQHFKHTLFVIPRIVPGTGVDGARTYNIVPTGKPGVYDLTINLYFPSNDEVLKSSTASVIKKDNMACNWDEVKYSLNKNIQDPQLKITTIGKIPLTSIELRIPEIKDVGLIGRSITTNEEADILDYYGKSLAVHIKITEAEKSIFQSKLVSQDGIGAIVKFRFQARSRNGSVHASVNLENLVQNFSAAASAKGLKFLASGDLETTLKSSLTENSIRITNESGTTEDSARITNMLIDKIFKEVSLSTENISAGATKQAKAGSGQVSVAAVIEILKTKINSEISYNLVAAPESASAQTEIKLRTDRLNDPNVAEVTLIAGYGAPSLGLTLNSGQSTTITPSYWSLDKINYIENRKYLSSGEIQNLNLGSYFPDLLEQSMVVQDIDINGTLLAEGKWTPLSGSSPVAMPGKYRWVRIQKEPIRFRDSSNIIQPTLEALTQLPIFVSFSELGDRRLFKLSELLEENPFWSATYDTLTGRLIVTAKQNLGTLRFHDRMRGKENIQYASIPLDQVFQIRTGFWGGLTYQKAHTLREDPRSIILQKSIVLSVTRPKNLTANELKYLKQAKAIAAKAAAIPLEAKP